MKTPRTNKPLNFMTLQQTCIILFLFHLIFVIYKVASDILHHQL